MILIDTHVLVWLTSGSELLGGEARRVLDQEWSSDGICVSAISFWEVAMLAGKGRLEISSEVGEWRREILDSGLVEIQLDGRIGVAAAQLADFQGDPADRFIVATALDRGVRLVTADRKIIDLLGSRATDARH